MILTIIIISLLGWIVNVKNFLTGSREQVTSGYSIILFMELLYNDNGKLAMIAALLIMASFAYAVVYAFRTYLED